MSNSEWEQFIRASIKEVAPEIDSALRKKIAAKIVDDLAGNSLINFE
jgi:hypothetical protein